MKPPKVSVCIPTYNGENFLEEALLSVISQSYKNYEILVSDDNSLDKSVQIAESLLFNFSPVPYRIIRNDNRGIGNNWNNCLKNARGEYIKFLFQDDVLKPNCLDKMVQILDFDKDVHLVASKRDLITDGSEYSISWMKKYSCLQAGLENFEYNKKYGRDLFHKWFFHDPMNIIGEPSCVLFRKSVIGEIGYFNSHFKQYLDFEYWYRIASKFNWVVMDQSLVFFRVHEQSASFENHKIKLNKEYRMYNRFFLVNKLFFFKANDIPILIRRAFRNGFLEKIFMSIFYLLKKLKIVGND